jgi:hypothetical protein
MMFPGHESIAGRAEQNQESACIIASGWNEIRMHQTVRCDAGMAFSGNSSSRPDST